MRNRIAKCILTVVLVGSTTWSVVAEVSEWLPLAVGNSWTHPHKCIGHDNHETNKGDNLYTPEGSWEFIVTVLGTEIIKEKTYFCPQ